MSEKIISPGVFTKEIDQSFLPAAIGDIGAAIVGPTVKGPAMVPTVVSSYSEFVSKFGNTFKSGSSYYQYLTSHAAENYLQSGNKLTVVRVLEGAYTPATASILGQDGNLSLTLTTLSHGHGQNSTVEKDTSKELSKGLLKSGSRDNLRWEIVSHNYKKGTFALNIRRGDDITKRKNILESWSNLTLDPNSTNYIGKRLGDQELKFRTDENGDPFIDYTGSFANKSKHVRVTVERATVDYLDENGSVRISGSEGYIPSSDKVSFGGGDLTKGYSGSHGGSFLGGSDGDVIQGFSGQNFYKDITGTNTQGFDLSTAVTAGSLEYIKAIKLLKNQDEYDINMLLLPGVIGSIHSSVVTEAIDMCEARGDVFYIADPVAHGSNLTDATSEADSRDTNYAAMYWPWVQVKDNQIGVSRWVPPSVVMSGVYAFNDSVSQPWFAPAGLNRGGIDTAIQAERKLTHSNRDDLYDANVNPIATFPGQGIIAWGQKTLQAKSSALDRVNVRRLMITVKKFIASTSRFLVFEQNNTQTRNRFLNIVNPYMEQVQANSGLSAFKVVMTDTNNTPDVVDRNILYGQIFVQPTRTAEFIVLDFTVQPTGATFPE